MEQEGVIKYSLDFTSQIFGVNTDTLVDINSCRDRLIRHGLLGQDQQRYDGYGFGNISIRSTLSFNTLPNAFLISGTQTGGETVLASQHLSCVTQIDIEKNILKACGEAKPSSEGMTHGVLYQQSKDIQAVVHVHSPDIWQRAQKLCLPATASNVPYGTPDMAKAVQKLFASQRQARKTWPIIFVMKGHEDGVVAAGKSLAQCTEALLQLLERSKFKSDQL